MEIYGSYHNHTKYSKFNHGKNTVAEICDEAQKNGFKEIAISDHAPSHVFGILKNKIDKERTEIDDYNNANNTMKVLMSMELNLLNLDGKCDLPDNYKDALDIKLLGFHKVCGFGFKSFFNFILPNIFTKKKMVEKNTDAYIACIKKYGIDLITHPQVYIKVNLKRLAEECVKNNCYIELNNRHFVLTEDEINELVATGVKFMVSTDAHKISSVNNFDCIKELINKYNIPINQIANIDALPDFKNKYTKE